MADSAVHVCGHVTPRNRQRGGLAPSGESRVSSAAGVPLIAGRGRLAFSLIAWRILVLVTSEPHSGQRTLSLICPHLAHMCLTR